MIKVTRGVINMIETKNLKLEVKPYKSDNYMGYNTVVQCLDGTKKRKKILGMLYVSFDHHAPRFLWENSEALSPSIKEYLELKAQKESEHEIQGLLRKSLKEKLN